MQAGSFLCVVALLSSCVLGYVPCNVDRNGGVVCSKTKYQGRCGTLTQPKTENWCTYEGTDMCCGNSVSDCCRDSGMVAAMTTIVLLTFAGICCCSLFCCHARNRFQRAGQLNGRNPRNASGLGAGAGSAPPGGAREHALTETHMEIIKEREREILSEYTTSRMASEALVGTKPKECVVCFENARCVLLPCGHCLLCHQCAEDILQSRSRQCPTCRTPFHVYEKVLVSLPSFRELSPLGLDLENMLDSLNTPFPDSVNTSHGPTTRATVNTALAPTSPDGMVQGEGDAGDSDNDSSSNITNHGNDNNNDNTNHGNHNNNDNNDTNHSQISV